MRCEINNTQIKYRTAKALLITIPRTKAKFWIPSKLVYPEGLHLSWVYLPEDMIFHCVKGKQSEFDLTAEELAEKLGYVSKEEIVPKYRKPVKRKIPKELLR